MSRKHLALLVVALVLLAGLSACGGSGSSDEAVAPAPPSSEPTATGPAASAQTLEVKVVNGQPVGGTKTLEVKQGDNVMITVEVDAPQELHLHGYDIEKEAQPGTPTVFEFTANLEGIFDLESHLADAKLVKLVVNP